ncbi:MULTISPECIES: DUF86 domain-containing protein [Metabacillus]|jgi:uncharacterized protein YutE (UPF0331/DUF86 family)|uniref:DUF86 domain-containing protein n=3 Tax=Metabacillus TaxID=2675233 RepID=A0A179T0X1_9BACI|nr:MULTISPECIES: DUF86 domain-containing protein [Metabacillus]OAS87158.1 hypothetical protein A6K24_20905 [Metabacillus litoralis]QNF26908.1 DUF86 domain-containing protein [Metabacillus sp. KUDC1714]
MYFVDREQIEAKLNFLENQLDLFISQADEWTSAIEKAALERICHMSIETILDVGNAIIDGFIMRDPGSYEDIIDILLDEKVINNDEAVGLKEVIHLRKVLVQDYLDVDHEKLVLTFVTNENNLNGFPTNVRNYIKNELGPVTAFKPV